MFFPLSCGSLCFSGRPSAFFFIVFYKTCVPPEQRLYGIYMAYIWRVGRNFPGGGLFEMLLFKKVLFALISSLTLYIGNEMQLGGRRHVHPEPPPPPFLRPWPRPSDEFLLIGGQFSFIWSARGMGPSGMPTTTLSL